MVGLLLGGRHQVTADVHPGEIAPVALEVSDERPDALRELHDASLLAEVRARLDLLWPHPAHARLAVLVVHREEDRVAPARKHDRSVTEDEGGAEVVPVRRQVAGLLDAEDEEHVEVGVLERLARLAQSFASHPAEVDALLPIDAHRAELSRLHALPPRDP